MCVTYLGFTRAQQGRHTPWHEVHLITLRHRVLSTLSRVTQRTNDNSQIRSQETQPGGVALSSPPSASGKLSQCQSSSRREWAGSGCWAPVGGGPGITRSFSKLSCWRRTAVNVVCQLKEFTNTLRDSQILEHQGQIQSPRIPKLSRGTNREIMSLPSPCLSFRLGAASHTNTSLPSWQMSVMICRA